MAQAGIHSIAGMAVRKWIPDRKWLMLGVVLGNLLPDADNLAVAIATVTNLERSPRPRREHLLEADEILTLVPGLEVVHHSEAWRENGRHEAHLVARAA